MSVPWRFRLVFGSLAVGCLVLEGWWARPVGALIKPLPVLSAAGWVFRCAPTVAGRRVGFGLLWSAAGDAALALDDRWFLAGLAAFLVAHLCYIAGFATTARLDRNGSLRAAGVVAYGVGMGFVIGAAVRWSPPVSAYIVVLTAMGVTAALRDGSGQVFIGALLFMVSDGLLAADRFLTPLPGAHVWVMLTYYAAQGLIAGGVIAENLQRRSPHAAPA